MRNYTTPESIIQVSGCTGTSGQNKDVVQATWQTRNCSVSMFLYIVPRPLSHTAERGRVNRQSSPARRPKDKQLGLVNIRHAARLRGTLSLESYLCPAELYCTSTFQTSPT